MKQEKKNKTNILSTKCDTNIQYIDPYIVKLVFSCIVQRQFGDTSSLFFFLSKRGSVVYTRQTDVKQIAYILGEVSI